MSRGHFKGGLVVVKHMRDYCLECAIQYVSCLDLALSDLPPKEAKIRQCAVKPPQKFFNAQEIVATGKQSKVGSDRFMIFST